MQILRLGTSVVVLCLASSSGWAAAPQSQFDESSRQAVQAASQAQAARDAARSAESKAEHAGDQASEAESRADRADDVAKSADSKANNANDAAKTASTKASTATDVAQDAERKADTANVQSQKAVDGANEAIRKADAATLRANEALKTAETAVPEAREEARKVMASATSVSSNRASHVVGAYLSLWGDPYPTTTGINVAYNVYDFLRVNVGFGSDDPDVFKLSTAGVGAKLFVPGWNLSPTVGMNISFEKRDNDTRPRTVRGFSPNGAIPYANFGFDWETGLGFDFAVGYDMPMRAGNSGSWYLNAGVFL